MTDTLVCHLHPTRIAKRRCYQCGRPICRSCQRRARGHIFCSSVCDETQAGAERAERLRKLAASPLRGARWRAVLWILFGGAAFAVGWAAVWAPGHLVPDPVAERGKLAGAKPPAPDLRSGAEIAIESPDKVATVMEPALTVRGRAPAGTMVGLYLENEPLAAVHSADGKWEFPGVALRDRVSVLQARYFDAAGRSGFSPAVKLLYAGRLAGPASAAVAAAPIETGRFEFTRGPRDLKRIMLTFDGGAEDREAPRIFQILRDEKIRATIFLTGEFIERYPELVRQAVADGHEIGNHSWSHPHLTTYPFNGRQATLAGQGEPFLREQLRRTAAVFEKTTGKKMAPFWRAPFGESNSEICRWAYGAGFTHVGWSPGLDTLDWVADPGSKLFMTPGQIREKLLARDKPPEGLNGGIVLMHLGTERHSDVAVPTMLPGLIAELRARGYAFGTASEMLINLEAGPSSR